jgi:hypothetical protein
MFTSSVALLSLLLLVSGCATYQGKVEKARQLLQNQETSEAIKLLEPLANKANDDQLVYMFDYAMALQIAGRYKESNEAFSKADHLSDIKNYLSVSRFAGSLLWNEEMQQYRGEDYERLLINLMAALNYVMLKDRESALVEIRRLYEKLEYYRIEEKKTYEQNTAAIYISAMLWEADKNWDSAYIDYERAYKRDESIKYIGEDLLRAAIRADRPDMVEKWRKRFGIAPKASWKDKNQGELVVVFQQGWGPRKAERARIATVNGFVSPGLPILQPVSSQTRRARVQVMPTAGVSGAKALYTENTHRIYSVQDTSMRALEDAFAPLIAKRIAAVVAKAAVSNQVAKKNEGLGALMNFAMLIADRADLRQWSTLPETVQVARVELPAGRYKVDIQGLTDDVQTETGEKMQTVEVEITPRTKTFINWRSLR